VSIGASNHDIAFQKILLKNWICNFKCIVGVRWYLFGRCCCTIRTSFKNEFSPRQI